MFKVTKMGLLNFWFYDEEEYEFYDGKILLRGQNGSGKSVTMQSFIPLILDGNKTPKRLDTFGGSDKHIEYYLLGDNKEVNTGYLYMEFYDGIKYVTIGIGLTARVGRQTEFFGFGIKDGSRINKDFYLYKLQGGFQKMPLTKNELKTKLAPNNIFVETQKEYKKMVNNLLYGFKNIDGFDEFISVILQIRSPKLSKEYKPSVLMKTLNDVLPPLSDEDLQPLSTTIEELNSIKEHIEELNDKISKLSNFTKIYNNYNESILFNKAKTYLNKKSEHEKLGLKMDECLKEIEDLKEQKGTLDREFSELTMRYEQAVKDKSHINNTDIEEKTKRLVEIEQTIGALEEKIAKGEDNLDSMNGKIAELKSRINELDGRIYESEQELKSQLISIEELLGSLHLDDGTIIINAIKSLDEGTIDELTNLIDQKKKEFTLIKNILEKKESLDREIDAKSREYGKEKATYEQLTEELNTKSREKDIEKDNLIEEIVGGIKSNREFVLSDEELKRLVNCFRESDMESFNSTREQFDLYYQNLNKIAFEKLSHLQVTIDNKKDELSVLNDELEVLKNETEEYLSENDLEVSSIEYLKTNHIPFTSFYKVIEFRDNVAKDTRDTLEANLLSSGILNAKVIREEDVKKLDGQNITYLIPSGKKKHNLMDYFVPLESDEFDKKYIESILESISTSSDDSMFVGPREYKFDFLNGKNVKYESKYIGILVRQEEHKRRIDEQIQKISSVENYLNELYQNKESIQKKIDVLKEEKEKFPNPLNLQKIISEIDKINLKIEVTLEAEHNLEEVIRTLNSELTSIYNEISAYKKTIKIPFNLESFKNAEEKIVEAKEAVFKLNAIMIEKENLVDLQNSNHNHMHSIEESYDMTFSEVAYFKGELKSLKSDRESIKSILDTKEYRELSLKLQKIEEIIQAYPKESNEYSKKIGITESQIEERSKSYDEIVLEEERSREFMEIYYNIVEEEHNLGYVLSEVKIDKNTVNLIIKNLGNANNRDNGTALDNFFKGLNDYRQSLLDYAINNEAIFTEKEATIKYYSERGLDKDIVREIYKGSIRQDVTAIYQGKKVNIFVLMENLKDEYSSNKEILNESDRHLFEDILLKTIGSKIKDKINGAKDWVDGINAVMQEKQQGTLRFFLTWSSKSRETLDEMDTRELYEIFKRDPETINREDTDKLIKHFRAKISRAEETMEDNKETYFDIVFRILDYRNWYQFKLFYKKGDDEKRELTDKAFSVFSGGEKAKTMYVPLFACAAAKLSSASQSAPRLIALDEAFAGVDDANIEEMFGIMKSFNLDYILTSQALWCDYSEIDDISICELLTDQASKTVAVKRYRWNGKCRVQVN